jgi:hypothetical protein
MNNLEQHVVSLNLAKQLEEAGYDQQTIYYWKQDEGEPYLVERNSRYFSSKGTILAPAPLASEIGEQLPAIDISNLQDGWQCWTSDNDGQQSHSAAQTLANLLAKHWLYLKKKGLL